MTPRLHIVRLLALLATSTVWTGVAQAEPPLPPPLPPTTLAYTIEVALDPADRTLDGHLTLRWQHTGERPIEAVPLHVYLNAFSHDGTTWMQGGPLNTVRYDDLTELYGDIWGWSEPKAITRATDAGPRTLTSTWIQPDDHNPLDRTLLLVQLDEPLQPGQTLTLDLDFEARLPIPIARTGGLEDFFLVAQWFPKIAAFEPRGLHGRAEEGFVQAQFHGPTEFYADFADYDVTILTPAGWTVAATGRQGARGTRPDGLAAVQYTQRAVHDFAFMASTCMAEHTFTHTPAGQRAPVEIRTLVPRGTEHQLPRWERAAASALDTMTRRVGPWPYAQLTVIAPPYRAARTGGMEYPTLITGLPGDVLWDHAPIDTFQFPELVVIHEFIHQYFYGLLASNERQEAFLDEGFTTFWEGEATAAFRGDDTIGTVAGRPIDALAFRSLGLRRRARSLDEPIARRPTWLFFPGTSGLQVYARTAATLHTAQGLFGPERLDAVFAAWYRRYAFRHPDLADFLAVAREVGGADVGEFFDEAFHARSIPDYEVFSASAGPWQPPHGRVPTDHGPRLVDADTPASDLEGIRPDVREADGLIFVEVTDPGWATSTDRQDGGITHRRVRPDSPASTRDDDPTPIESHVRLRGPGWQHLPVTVVFTFEDGVRWHETWDGRATWRDYRFLRPAALARVELDPEHLLTIDVLPENGAWTLQPDRGFAADASLWLSALVQWLAQGVTLWL